MADNASEATAAPVEGNDAYPTAPAANDAGSVDFNALHDQAKADEAESAKLLDKTVDPVLAGIERETDTAKLATLRDAEVAGKNRSTVLTAIDARTAALAA